MHFGSQANGKSIGYRALEQELHRQSRAFKGSNPFSLTGSAMENADPWEASSTPKPSSQQQLYSPPPPPPMVLGSMPLIDADMPFNPFSNTEGSIRSSYEAAKTALLLPLCAFRMTLFVGVLFLGLIFARIALLGANEVLTRPFPWWRRRMLWPTRLMARFLLFLCGFQWIVIRGKPAARKRAPIIVCNHVTFVDPVFLFYKHLPVIVTAEENLNYPLAGSIIKAMQPIALKRKIKASRQNAATEIKMRAKSGVWNSIMIFPEATTTNGKALVSFKSGAFTTDSPIQPMVVRYPHVHLDPSWVAVGPSIYYLLFRLMTQFHNHMEIEYLPVMEPTWQEQSNPRAFAERVRTAMAMALNIVVTEHTFEDLAVLNEARKAKAEVALLEFGRFERLYGLTSKEAKRYFHKFRALDVRKKGMVTLDDLLDYLELPDIEAVRQVYSLFDSRGCGYFNFRQYTAGLLFIARYQRIREAIEEVFRICDRDADGVLSRADLWEGLSELIPQITPEQAKAAWNKINVKRGRFVYRIEFLTFLERNPEFIAVILFASPGLLNVMDGIPGTAAASEEDRYPADRTGWLQPVP